MHNIPLEEIIGYILIYFAEAVILYRYSSRMFQLRISPGKAFLSCLAMYAIPYVLVFRKSLPINLLSFFFACFASIFLLFQCKWYIAAFHALLHLIIMSATELIVGTAASGWMLHILNRPFEITSFIAYGVSSKLLYLGVSEMFSYFERPKKHGQPRPVWPECYIIILNTAADAFLLFFFLIVGNDLKMNSALKMVFSAVSAAILIINLLSYYLFDRLQHRRETLDRSRLENQKWQFQAYYYSTLQQETQQRSILIHDIRNHLNAVSLLLHNDKSDQAASYVNQLLSLPSLAESVRLCDNDLLNGILSYYRFICCSPAN